MVRTAGLLAAAGVIGLAMTGCANERVNSGSPAPSASSAPGAAASPLPTTPSAPVTPGTDVSPMSSVPPPRMRPPSGPPKTPSDRTTSEWTTGTVTAGGTGPCYGLETDDGRVYAMYSAAGTRLEKGTRVRAKFAPLTLRIHCGPGEHVAIRAVEPVR